MLAKQKKDSWFYIKAPFRFLYKVYFGLIFFITLAIQFPIYYLLTRSKKHNKAVIAIKRYFWSPLMQLLLLVWVRKIKSGKYKKNQAYIICPNHSSYHDIVFMTRISPRDILFMGKAELKKWPLMQVFFKNGKYHIAVDRKNAREAARALDLAKERIKEGYSVVIFPEGTIADSAPVLNRFKQGAFKLAIETQTPVVPVTFLDHWYLMSDPEKLFGPCTPGISRVIIHDPIETVGMTEKDIVPLQQKVFDIIEADLKQYVYPKLKSYGAKS